MLYMCVLFSVFLQDDFEGLVSPSVLLKQGAKFSFI